MLESIVYNKVTDFLGHKISCQQFGFMKKCSYLSQLLSFLADIHHSLDNRTYTDVVHLTHYLTMNCYLSFGPWESLEIYGNGLKSTCVTGSTSYRLKEKISHYCPLFRESQSRKYLETAFIPCICERHPHIYV